MREPGWEGEAYGPPRDDRRLDRLVSAGRQLVDGVAGTRPGSRPSSRSAARPRLDSLGRWVENKLDWLLEDGDDWREPWQEPRREGPREAPRERPAASRGRQPLEAISRRGSRRDRPSPGLNAAGPAAPVEAAPDDAWPDDTAFTVPRWQRGATPPAPLEPPPPPQSSPRSPGRALPRSSRRRS